MLIIEFLLLLITGNLPISIDSQTVLAIAAIVVILLKSKLVFKILNNAAKLILTIATIVLGLQYLFGISPNQLWYEIAHLPQELIRLVEGVRLPELGLI